MALTTDFLNLEIEDDVVMEEETSSLPTSNTGASDSLVDELSDDLNLKPSEIDEPAPPMDSISDDTDKEDKPADIPENGEISDEPIMPETMPGDGDAPTEEKKDYSAPVTDSPFDDSKDVFTSGDFDEYKKDDLSDNMNDIEDDDNEEFAKMREELSKPAASVSVTVTDDGSNEGPMKYVPLYQRRDTNDVSDFGSDNDFNGAQNQYDDKEITTINELVASEASALTEYTTAAKNSKLDTLQRLYSDIADEERFHLEQLLYAKSVITGEKYIPRDPDVKREYKELVALGMDEETAMTTAVDKVGLMPQGITPDDMIEAAQEVSEMREYFLSVVRNTSMVLEQLTDNGLPEDVSETIQETYNELMGVEVDVFQEAVANIKNDKTFNPITFLWNLVMKIYNALLAFIRKIKSYIKKMFASMSRSFDWLKSNGIKGLFADGVRLYFYNEKKMDVDKAGIASYLQCCIDVTMKICDNCGIPMRKIPDVGAALKTDYQHITFRTVSDGVDAIRGILVAKSKVIITDNNEAELEALFFGYSKDKIKVKGKVSSENIFNTYENALEIATSYFKILEEVCKDLKGLDANPQSVYFTHKSDVYDPCMKYMNIIVKFAQKLVNGLTSDIDECMKLNNRLYEMTKSLDAAKFKGNPMVDGKPIKTRDSVMRSSAYAADAKANPKDIGYKFPILDNSFTG
jgi:rubrerythrin